MLHYAYSRQLPVQIVVTDGKEAVISEKHMSAHFGQTLLVGYSNVIRSAVRPAFHPCVCRNVAAALPTGLSKQQYSELPGDTTKMLTS